MLNKVRMSCQVHDVRFYKLLPRAIHCMAIEPRCQKLAVSRSDNSIEIWDVAQHPHIERCIYNLKDDTVEALAWCGDRLFSTGFKGVVVEYDRTNLSRKCEQSLTGPAWCLAVNRQETYLAIGSEDGFINLFEVANGDLKYEKIMDRQEGRILCIAWSQTGDMIVTGSIDTIRIWNFKTGHAIHKIGITRAFKNKATTVWCMAVTDDFTIITGDSRGWLSFWNGHQGILMEAFETHSSDILALCVTDDQKSVYCAGVDPTISCFSKIAMSGSNKDQTHWVKSVQRRIHQHDVRALAMNESQLISGGIDGYLTLSSYPPKVLFKHPPFLQGSCGSLASEARCLLLRYPTYLQVWELGKDAKTPHSVLLLTLNSCAGDPILCASISSDASWIAYSTPTATRLFSFNKNVQPPTLQKVSYLPEEVGPSHKIVFTPDNCHVLIATNTGELLILELKSEPILLNSLQPIKDKLLNDRIFLLEISRDGKLIIAADHCSSIVAWTFDGKVFCVLPKYKCPPTAMAVQPETNILVVAYSDQKVVEYSLPMKCYTDFSRKLNADVSKHWLSKGYAITGITFDPRNLSIIVLHDDNVLHVINKEKQLPTKTTKIPRIGSPHSDSADTSGSFPSLSYALHSIKKYKHIAYLNWLKGDELVVVEVSPPSLEEQLLPSLVRKRFGM